MLVYFDSKKGKVVLFLIMKAFCSVFIILSCMIFSIVRGVLLPPIDLLLKMHENGLYNRINLISPKDYNFRYRSRIKYTWYLTFKYISLYLINSCVRLWILLFKHQGGWIDLGESAQISWKPALDYRTLAKIREGLFQSHKIFGHAYFQAMLIFESCFL